jgi:hypothetical protein
MEDWIATKTKHFIQISNVILRATN